MRLCKGIYVEPAEIAYRDFDSVRASFVQALEELLELGCYVGIATHDEWLLEQGQRLVAARGLGREEYEFQMLLGVRPALGDQLVREGHRLRIYTPFGRALVRVLAAAAAGEPEARRLHRRGHGRAAAARAQRLRLARRV